MSRPSVIRIDYESEGFSPGGPVSNGHAVLETSWDDLLWAAMTIGRPNRQYVFRYGLSSMYEALFRISLVRMALEQSGPRAYRLNRTQAVKTLDPSEKGAVSYFLGMVMCKLFSAKLLDAPWVLHLDVFRDQLNPKVLGGRSRPDLVGQTSSGEWVALESKGRVSQPSSDVKNKAKQQAKRLISVDGLPPSFQIGAVTYFRNDVLQFFWRDPEPGDLKIRNSIKVNTEEGVWGYYYRPIFELLRSYTLDSDEMPSRADQMVIVKELDLDLSIHPIVLKHLLAGQWGNAKKLCTEHVHSLTENGYQADGIRVIAGDSWFQPFED
ncbi:MAG TPA: hypothetical protein VMT62_10540 [Syntrophorhabdaceae bacterium]|nr:hypothetical protein [Syntrophorhabdaceae bacterium]